MATGSTVTKEKEHELVLTRVCDAPREPAFKRGPIQNMAQWWGSDDEGYPELVASERFIFMRTALDKEGDPPLAVLGTVTTASKAATRKQCGRRASLKALLRPVRISREWKRAGNKAWSV